MEASLDISRFTHTVFDEGKISTLYGPPGAGKTSLAVLFMEFLVERGYNVYTIINFFKHHQIPTAIYKKKLVKIPKMEYVKKPDEIHIINTLSELLVGLLTTEKNVTIVDEGGMFGSSRMSNSIKVRTLLDLAFTIRHLDSALLLIAQSKGSVIPDLRQTLVEFEMRVRNLNYTRMFSIATAVPFIDDYSGEEIIRFEVAEGDEYYGIPPTKYPFDSKFIPAFDMDLDLHEAYRRMSKFNSIEIREKDAGAQIVRDLMAEKKLKGTKGKTIKSEAEAIFDKGYDGNLKDLAKKLGTTYGNIKFIRSGWLGKQKG